MLLKIKYHLLQVASFLILGEKIIGILKKFQGMELQLEMIEDRIVKTFSELKEAQSTMRRSTKTETLAKLDSDRDDAWISFSAYVKSCAYRLNDSYREQAFKLRFLMNSPDMKDRKMGYKKQTVALENFFQKIEGQEEFSNALTGINGMELYNELKEAQKAFAEMETIRVEEEANKPKINSEQYRKELRKNIDDLEQFLNVMFQMTQKEEYQQIAAEINEVIESINTASKSRATRRENGAEQEDNIIDEGNDSKS